MQMNLNLSKAREYEGHYLSGERFLAIQPAVENGIWGQKRYMKNEREEGKGS